MRRNYARALTSTHIGGTLARVALVITLCASSAAADSPDLTELSLEALMNLEVTSVSKKEELAQHAAAAVFVLTNEDIRRSGATSIPEVLRLVPGLNVARIDSSRWAITARGFNGLFASKLLVLIDGRSVYTPLFSGVNWDVQDTVLEDVDRIEVIRGPGAALWGSNAVNGVINIITKNAAETTGGLAALTVGKEDRLITTMRYGDKVSDQTALRGFLKYFNRDESESVGGGDNYDQWDMWRGGSRMDWTDGGDSFMLDIQGYGGNEATRGNVPTYQPPYSVPKQSTGYAAGGHVLGRWEGALSESTTGAFQGYYDQANRDGIILRQAHNTVDFDAQAQTKLSDTHALMYGLNYRYVHDDLRERNIVSFDPVRRNTSLVSMFLQDELQLIPQELKLILGVKLEHNDFTGFEFEPNARASWNFTPAQTVWAAVSRATRTPNRAETDITLINSIRQDPITGLPLEVDVVGNRSLESEDLLATELGYRIQTSKSFSADLALFYNHYSDVGSFEQQEPEFRALPVPAIHVPLRNSSNMLADTFGGELVVNFIPVTDWRLQASYAYVRIATATASGMPATLGEPDRETPQNQFTLRSLVDLPYNLEFDTTLRYVDHVPQFGISAYTEMSLRLGWHVSKNLEFSLLAENVLSPDHREYIVDLIQAQPAEVERNYLAKVTWRF